ncbi:MAG TPA: preprotein translocase subunit SecA [bacterium]|nr:preprotein translocase subunit SecA [bacterium]
MVFDAIKGLFDENKRVVARLEKIVEKVNSFSAEMERLDDEALRAKTEYFRERLSKGETLDQILPEAFAVAREAADRRCVPGGMWSAVFWDNEILRDRIKDPAVMDEIRKIKKRIEEGETAEAIMLPASFYDKLRAMNMKGARMRPFDVQVMGGIVLHEGNIAEMKTGEGKTLAATLPVYLNGLSRDGVHVVTVNDYLAKRDSRWMGTIYRSLGLTVGVIQHDMDPDERKEAYNADITYGTNNEFGFDYLRDNMVIRREDMVQHGHNFAIVDEVDSILIDEARTPLIISGQADQDVSIYYRVNQAVRKLVQHENLFEFDEKEHSANLTEEGQVFVARQINMPDLFDWGREFDFSNATDKDHQKLQYYNEIISTIQSSIKAYTLYKLDRDYIVKDGQVIIVDEFTGRLMFGRRYSEGLHQAIEAKESVKIEHESQTLATITFQNFFRMYQKLGGMTGTAKTEEGEFSKIYGLDVVVLPTNMPMVRKDLPDMIYKSEKAKFDAVVEEIHKCHKKGQPVLVGTVSVEKSELLSRMLLKKGVTHNVLNAKHHEREAEIVSEAGRRAQVTIATNMAGRGTDIVLGDGVADLGGLHIIGTERHESRRIDNQLRGRSGRQGDPGSSRFYLSLEDDLMRLFGSDRIKGLMDRVGFRDDEPIEHPWVTKSIESAQRKVEGRNFEIRKHVLEYDDVMNKQRETVYEMRQSILYGEDTRERILDFIEKHIDSLLDRYCNAELDKKDWNLEALYEEVFILLYRMPFTLNDLAGKTRENLREMILEPIHGHYDSKEERLGSESMRELERVVLLRTIDEKWIDHLYAMDHLKEGIGLRAYGQVNPIVAYQKEAYEMFSDMKDDIRRTAIRLVLLLEVVQQRRSVVKTMQEESADESGGGEPRKASSSVRASKVKKKVGRNDPCPCGSGKKYKNCCIEK